MSRTVQARSLSVGKKGQRSPLRIILQFVVPAVVLAAVGCWQLSHSLAHRHPDARTAQPQRRGGQQVATKAATLGTASQGSAILPKLHTGSGWGAHIGFSKAPSISAGVLGSCTADVCVDVDLSQVQRGSDVMYGLAWEDINHS